MRLVRTLFILGSSLGLVTALGCKPEPTPEPPPSCNQYGTAPSRGQDGSGGHHEARGYERREIRRVQKAASAALKDINFDFDKADIRDGDKPKLQAIAAFMKAFGSARIMIEGHCDERGTVEATWLWATAGPSPRRTIFRVLASTATGWAPSATARKSQGRGPNEESFFINRRDEFRLQN